MRPVLALSHSVDGKKTNENRLPSIEFYRSRVNGGAPLFLRLRDYYRKHFTKTRSSGIASPCIDCIWHVDKNVYSPCREPQTSAAVETIRKIALLITAGHSAYKPRSKLCSSVGIFSARVFFSFFLPRPERKFEHGRRKRNFPLTFAPAGNNYAKNNIGEQVLVCSTLTVFTHLSLDVTSNRVFCNPRFQEFFDDFNLSNDPALICLVG